MLSTSDITDIAESPTIEPAILYFSQLARRGMTVIIVDEPTNLN
jgi:hypothetical protein